MILWIVTILVVLAGIFTFLGWRWESDFRRPELQKKLPLVSILIPTYHSEQTVEEVFESVKELDYPNKEVFVINDSPDNVCTIAKKYGFNYIENKKRLGKPKSINNTVKKTNGEILFILDSDTTIAKDCLKKTIPWFSDPNIALVQPRFLVKNKNKNTLTRLISLENNFIASHFKIHMFFGGLITFRNCGAAIRRSVFEKLGGFPETQTEDNDFGGMLIKNNKKIQYDPEAVVETLEPESISELKSQRYRWGNGAAFSFFHHYKFYSKNMQFFTNIYMYILIALAIIGFFLWQTTLFFVPLISLYLIYTFSIKEFVLISILFLIPIISNFFASVTTASFSYVVILTTTKKSRAKDLLLVLPYIFFYLPLINFYYFKGIISGVINKKRGKSELNLSKW